MDLTAKIQSNSIRGTFARGIVDATIDEMLADIAPSFGPGAVDSYIVKNGAPYYTRDGKEVMESLTFDNELANYVHRILYQAVYNQGQNVGDGSTTLAVLYCNIYRYLHAVPFAGRFDVVRRHWNKVVELLIDRLKDVSVDLDDQRLLSMLYTCTKDSALTKKIYDHLREPLMDGAYIIPRKSNIASDFEVTVHTKPLLSVTRQWSVFPVHDTEDRAVIFYCNGVIDIADERLIPYLMGTTMSSGDTILPMTVILLGHGINESTRRILKELSPRTAAAKADENNNVVIYTLDHYREMNGDELEDLSVMLSGQAGISTMTRSLTYSAYLMGMVTSLCGEASDVTLDYDPATLEAMRDIFRNPYRVTFDPVNGMALDKPLNPKAKENYDRLRNAIAMEKSPVKKLDLTRRLQRSFGMFIELEVGSALLKDSQRKFELILDAILSSSEAAKDGVIVGSSVLHLYRILNSLYDDSDTSLDMQIIDVLRMAVGGTIRVLAENMGVSVDVIISKASGDGSIDLFNAEYGDGLGFWPADGSERRLTIDEEGDGTTLAIDPTVVEPFGVMKAILENSFLPVELVHAKVFHITGSRGFMGNYIN